MKKESEQEKAEKIVVNLLQKRCRQTVYDLGWDWNDRSKQCTYASMSLEERKFQAGLFYESVSAFDLSPKSCAIVWWPLLQVELMIEACYRIVGFINDLQVVDQKIDIPASIISQIMAWYPTIVQSGEQDKLNNMTDSALTRAFLFEVVKDKDASFASVSEFISIWLESGLISLVDGDFFMGGFRPPEPDDKREYFLPMSNMVYDALYNAFLRYRNDDTIRAQSVKAVIKHFGMNRHQLNKLTGEAFTSYCKREYASIEGMVYFIRRIRLLDLVLPSVYRKILAVAPKEFGDILFHNNELDGYLLTLRSLCDAYDLSVVQRDRIIRALWQNEEAQRHEYLKHKAQVVEALYIEIDRVERIQRLIKEYENQENIYSLSQLLDLAISNDLSLLVEELRQKLEVIKPRQKEQEEEEKRKREREKVEAQIAWENKLQQAVQLLEKEPRAGAFLSEAYKIKPAGRQNTSCVIATSTTASLYLEGEADTILNTLRAFRDSVIKRLPRGDALIDHYNKTAPPVARWVAKNRLIRASFWYGFIRPSMYLLKQRKTRLRKFIVNLAVTIIFLVGLAWTTSLRFFAPKD